MSEQVIIIHGAAFPKAEASFHVETTLNNQYASNLEKGGHQVARVGMPWRGFYWRHLEKAFQELPYARLVIANIHGSIKDDQHSLAVRHEKSSHLMSGDFYQKLAAVSGNRTLNIFMFSCGSGNGCFDAIQYLPLGSTLINTSREGTPTVTLPCPEYLQSNTACDKPLAEHLFLNMLSKGHDDETLFQPQLSISTPQRALGDTWSLWDLIRAHILTDNVFEPSFEFEVTNFLTGYFPKDKIREALRTIEFYEKVTRINMEGLRSEDTPVTIRSEVCERDFLRECQETNVLGAMYAVSYYAFRDEIGAFKAGTHEVCKTISPGMRNDLLPSIDQLAHATTL